MRALEIDQRAVAFLNLKLPGFDVIHMDVLDADWSKLAAERNGTLSVIANLPYYIVSQVIYLYLTYLYNIFILIINYTILGLVFSS